MIKTGLAKDRIIEKAAELANREGAGQITIKMLASELGVKPPSLYNHITGLDDLQKNLMLYGWRQMGEKLIISAAGIRGYDAVKAMCYAFYDYAVQNPGIFEAMLWYNRFQDEEALAATSSLLTVIFRITSSLDIPEQYGYHLIRTFRGFLEGFFLLNGNGSFGYPLAARESFALSVDILVAGIKALASQGRFQSPSTPNTEGGCGNEPDPEEM